MATEQATEQLAPLTRDRIVTWLGQCDDIKDIELIVRAARARVAGIANEIEGRKPH